MKTLRLMIPFLLFSILLPAVSQASVVPDRVEMQVASTARPASAKKHFLADSKMAKKAVKKLNKMLQRIEDRTDKVDFNDPVDKWMWFWIFGWGAGLVFSIMASIIFVGTGFGLFWMLSSAAWLFGTVALVIWLVKKFE